MTLFRFTEKRNRRAIRPACLVCQPSKSLEFVTDTQGECPVETVDAFFREDEFILRTYIKGKLEHRNGGEIEFKTRLTGNGHTDTVIDAVAHLGTGTGIPSQPFVETTFELVDTSQIEEVEVGKIHAQIEFSAIGSQRFLVGDFSTIV